MISFEIQKLDTVDSTSEELKKQVESTNVSIDKILIARVQTNPMSIDDNKIVCNKDKGIYFSYAKFYDAEFSDILQKATYAVYKTFKLIFGIELSIKSSNSLYFDNKKVACLSYEKLEKTRTYIISVNINLFNNDEIQISDKYTDGYIFIDKKDLISKLDDNFTNKNVCTYRNIYNSFKSISLTDVEINDDSIWEADSLVVQIVMNIENELKNSKGRKNYEDS